MTRLEARGRSIHARERSQRGRSRRRPLRSLWGLGGILLLPAAHAQVGGDMPGYWHREWDWGWGWGHMLVGGVMMALVWGSIVVLVILAVRWLSHGTPRAPDAARQPKRALEILEERFARGEIEKEEFEERRRLLSE